MLVSEFHPPNYTEKNQGLQADNRRLKERLLQLYMQIDALSTVSDSLGGTAEKSGDLAPAYGFVQTDSTVIPGGAIYSAALDPQGRRVALASLSGSVTVVSPTLGQQAVLTGHEFACRDVKWGAAGLVSCGFDKTIRIWDVPKAVSQTVPTAGLAHSVCSQDDDQNVVFGAAGDQIYWIDKRRSTPLSIAAGTEATSVACFHDMLLFGGYDGFITIVDRRALQNGPLARIEIDGGPISSISRVIETGRCVVMSSNGPPQVLVVGDTVQQRIKVDPPMRFGCRADITEHNWLSKTDYAALFGGRDAVFFSGSEDCPLQRLESIGGFHYGAIFTTAVSHKVLSYSEDGVVSLWSVRKAH